MDLSATLEERRDRYGDFLSHAVISQDLKHIVRGHLCRQQKVLSSDQQEALEMILHKLGRIINGDPNYADSWHDIAGYAQLVADRLNKGPLA